MATSVAPVASTPPASGTFDRDAYLATVAPPVFLAGGRRVVGRILSWEEWLPLEELFARAAKGETDQGGLRAAVRTVCDTMFPPAPWWRRWLAGAARSPSVYAEIRRLPMAGQLEAIRTFAERQAAIQRGPRLTDQPPAPSETAAPTPTPEKPSDGTPSPA